MNIGGQECTFAILLSHMMFIKRYLGRKYNVESKYQIPKVEQIHLVKCTIISGKMLLL